MARPTARGLLESILDIGTFISWDETIDISTHKPAYRDELAAAAERAEVDESVITGSGAIGGRQVALIVNEFRFMGGSVGVTAASRIIAAIRRATAEGLPLIASTSSGGTRMVEGTPAFVQMAEIVRVIAAHKAAALPYLVYIRHPTTGGVLASWGSLGHISVAEPGALVAFLGPKVSRAITGKDMPVGVQVAENLARNGIVDAVASPQEFAGIVRQSLDVLIGESSEPTFERRPLADPISASAWDSVQRTRRPGRPGVREVLRFGATQMFQMRCTDRERATLVAIARIDGQPCMIVGTDRSAQEATHALGPGSLQIARHGIRLAEELRLPVVTFIDTPGAELSPAAEEGGLSEQIARCTEAMVTTTVPTVAVLLGAGAGGGALALLPARRVIAAEHAWLAPIPPEGASVIVHGVADYAAELANTQRISAIELWRTGTVHSVVAEYPDDETEPSAFARAIAAEIAHHLLELRDA